MTTRIEQWQAGQAVEGFPPWDGTGIPFPTGWDGPVTSTLVITEPEDGAEVDPLVTIRGTGAQDGDTVDLYMDSSPGAPVASVTAEADGSFEFAGTTPLEVSPEGIQVGVGTARSPKIHVTLAGVGTPTMGWTKAELIQFAEDHDPPITVPTSGTKAEILAAILAYIEAHPEEN